MLIKLSDIHLSPTNPRCTPNPKLDAELLESVRRHGVLQPVLVRANALLKQPWELICGSRRFHAATEAGLEEIPAIEKDLSDGEVLEVQIIENLQRTDVHPLEEAEAYRKLHESYKYDVARIAERVGRSVAYVYDRIRLCALTKEAADHFRVGRITAGHAILLARLKPADQAKALDLDAGGVFTQEHTLWNPSQPDIDSKDRFAGMKTRTVRELQGWIDDHVKFDMRAEDVPDLFPETHEAIAHADKVVPITWDHQVPPSARDGQKIVVQQSWRRADGKQKSKKCDKSLLGVVVIGGGRGEAFDVCVDKTCRIHWADKIRAAKEREEAKAAAASPKGSAAAKSAAAREAAREKLEAESRERRERLRERWRRATPAIVAAIAENVNGLSDAQLLKFGPAIAARLHRHNLVAKDLKLVPPGNTLAHLVRHLLFMVAANNPACRWNGPEYAPEVKKLLGLDLRAVVDRVAPEAPAAPAGTVAETGPQKPDAKRTTKPKPKTTNPTAARPRKKGGA